MTRSHLTQHVACHVLILLLSSALNGDKTERTTNRKTLPPLLDNLTALPHCAFPIDPLSLIIPCENCHHKSHTESLRSLPNYHQRDASFVWFHEILATTRTLVVATHCPNEYHTSIKSIRLATLRCPHPPAPPPPTLTPHSIGTRRRRSTTWWVIAHRIGRSISASLRYRHHKQNVH